MDMRRLERDERADFAAFLATLMPPQWEAPTASTPARPAADQFARGSRR